MKLSFDDEESFKEAAGTLNFNNPPSDPDSLLKNSTSSSTPSQERSEDTEIYWYSRKLWYISSYNFNDTAVTRTCQGR